MKENQVFRNKAIPLYYQLETILRKRLLSGEFEPGAFFTTGDTLAKECKVSRIVVSQALSALEKDGFIVRRRGKGTFVSENIPSFELPKLTGSIADLISTAVQTHPKILDFSWRHVDKKIADCLGLPEGTMIVYIERLLLAKGSPLCYVVNYLPPTIGEKIQPEDILVKPLLSLMEDDLGIKLADATQKIGADIADSYIAPLLEVRAGDPLLKIERIIFDSNGRAVDYVSVLYRADRYYYTVRLKRRKIENNSQWIHI